MRESLVFLAVVSGLTAHAGESWPNWRGPTLNGVSSATALPTEWSDSRNIVWKTPLPSWGGATPIVWKDRIFVLSPSKPEATAREAAGGRSLPAHMGGREHPGGPDILLLCLSAADGTLIWQKKVDDRNKLFGKQNMASPSPVTDGKLVWALSGNGVLAAFDFDGNEVWRIDLQSEYGEFGLLWGYASSPLLVDNLLIVQVLHGFHKKGPSYLAAFDAATGKPAWHQPRITDATAECPDAYTTPTIARAAGRAELIVSGADYLTAHDPTSGRELWRAAGLNPNREGNYRICGSPLVVGDVVVAPSRKRPVLAVRTGGEGDVGEARTVWKLERGGPDVPTPVSDGARVYFAQDQGFVTCVDAKDGRIVWGPERTATGTVSASPLLADGKLYVTNENAITTVLAAGPEFKILSTNELDGGYTLSSPIAVGSRLYVRTATHLYCIGSGGK